MKVTEGWAAAIFRNGMIYLTTFHMRGSLKLVKGPMSQLSQNQINTVLNCFTEEYVKGSVIDEKQKKMILGYLRRKKDYYVRAAIAQHDVNLLSVLSNEKIYVPESSENLIKMTAAEAKIIFRFSYTKKGIRITELFQDEATLPDVIGNRQVAEVYCQTWSKGKRLYLGNHSLGVLTETDRRFCCDEFLLGTISENMHDKVHQYILKNKAALFWAYARAGNVLAVKNLLCTVEAKGTFLKQCLEDAMQMKNAELIACVLEFGKKN